MNNWIGPYLLIGFSWLLTLGMGTPALAEKYPQAAIDAFMEGCVGSSQDAEYCTCVINQLQQAYTLEQFLSLAVDWQQGKRQTEFVNVISGCAQQVLNRPDPNNRPAQSATQPGDLNAKLQNAVDAQDWNQAIQIVDQMIPLFPNQTDELRTYRAQLEKLRNP